ncbi:hypothetical protein [Runella sp.]|jgi:1,4-alpha-glucan branching enzyme|uniref:hypothetical protein n=1 Tax=Runella sp. TaxID=1960881 RepID=UPI002617A0A4|nr:hypothetical protein [Runella sp.]
MTAISTLKHSSKTEGMGAIPTEEGVSFRVWAPNAQKVSVVGDFNGWKKNTTPLVKEENGNWSVEVPNAKPEQQYKYYLKTSVGELWRNDPYALELTNSVGNSIIHDADFDWGDDNFQMPNWNELVIYELHVGTFNVKEENKPGDFYSVIERLN